MNSHPPSPAHRRLAAILRTCPGSTTALRTGLETLDDDTAGALARVLELLHGEASRAAGGRWARGFAAGQQA